MNRHFALSMAVLTAAVTVVTAMDGGLQVWAAAICAFACGLWTNDVIRYYLFGEKA